MPDDNGLTLDRIEPTLAKRIHLIGVGGTGMGSFAGMLKAAGYHVSGSDESLYPPMSTMLATWGIEVHTPYASNNLDAARPDLVIVGNVIRRVNVEASAARERRLPQMSFPAALSSFFLARRHCVVVAGTHGKTTTSALMGHVLTDAGLDPSFLVGGVPLNSGANFRLGQGPHFVVEGDEYDTAYFDKGPKFLHYQPKTLLLTSVELDHADIYRDQAHYEESFERLVALVPPDGTIVVCAQWPNAVRLARASRAKVVTYSVKEGSEADFAPQQLELGPWGARFVVRSPQQGPSDNVSLPLAGAHNVENALGVFAASRALGLAPDAIARGFASFRGVKRRQEVRGQIDGVTVIDDFAHHPTAVKQTIAAIASRYPGRRLWAIFEPRSNTSRRDLHQQEYAQSFAGAARASIRIPPKHDKIPAGHELDVPRLAADLSAQNIPSVASPSVAQLLEEVKRDARAGDVLLVMSNGSFEGFIDRLSVALAERTRQES